MRFRGKWKTPLSCQLCWSSTTHRPESLCAQSLYFAEYYPPLTVLNVSAHQDQLPQHQSKEKVAAYVNRTREELMYQATFNLSVKYERKKEEVSDRLGCPVHACWCWDSCNVRHILNITVTIDGHIRREINRVSNPSSIVACELSLFPVADVHN